MSLNIVTSIFELSLLNLYAYTDCQFLSIVTPTGFGRKTALSALLHMDIHLITPDEFSNFKMGLQKELTQESFKRIEDNFSKIDHTLEHVFYKQINVMISSKNNNLYVTFRGTGNIKEAYYDMKDIFSKDNSNVLFEGSDIKIYPGFHQILDDNTYDELNIEINKLWNTSRFNKVIFSGHSLGAALSAIFIARAIHNEELYLTINMENYKKNYFLYLFGSPCIGNLQFVDYMRLNLGYNYINIVNNNDYVVSFMSNWYHLDNTIHFEKNWSFYMLSQLDRDIDMVLNKKISPSSMLGKIQPLALIEHGIWDYNTNIYNYIVSTNPNPPTFYQTSNSVYKQIFNNIGYIFNFEDDLNKEETKLMGGFKNTKSSNKVLSTRIKRRLHSIKKIGRRTNLNKSKRFIT